MNALMNNIKIKRALACIDIIICLAWVYLMKNTESYFSIYIGIALLSIVSVVFMAKSGDTILTKDMIISGLCSTVFAALVMGGDYFLYFLGSKKSIIISLITFLITAIVFANIILFISRLKLTRVQRSIDKAKCRKVFIIVFAAICVIDLIYLIFGQFPGSVPADTRRSMAEIISGQYTDINPFWHTVLIAIPIKAVMAISSNMNAAIAVTIILQIIIVSLCYAYMIETLYEAGMPMWTVIVSGIYMAILPANINYASALLKDVIFSVMVLLFVTALFRLIDGISEQNLNGKGVIVDCILLVLGELGFGLLRHNGILGLVPTAIVFVIFYRKNYIKLNIIILITYAFVLVLRFPSFFGAEVVTWDSMESFPLPVQQVARVVCEDKEISDEHIALIEKLMPIETIKEKYVDCNVDPIKFGIRELGNGTYLDDHKSEYVQMWKELGAEYPRTYVEAWINLTRNYWCGGYTEGIYWENQYPEYTDINGNVVKLKEYNNPLEVPFQKYAQLYENKLHPLEWFNSIGLFFWITILLFIICCMNNKKNVIIIIPGLFLELFVAIGTPISYEYRYSYYLFLLMPIMLLSALYIKRTDAKLKSLS